MEIFIYKCYSQGCVGSSYIFRPELSLVACIRPRYPGGAWHVMHRDIKIKSNESNDSLKG
jgi:hypothetical protein